MSLPDAVRRLAWRLAGRNISAEDERLQALFRNRTELKHELSALDEERHQLLDRLKLQEGATMRVQEQLDALEQYLGRPDEGEKCLAHFRLRSVWRAGSRRLQQFATDLTRQQKDRERRQQAAAFEREQRSRVDGIDRELVEARMLADQLQAEQRLVQQRLVGLRGFWNYFRRKRLAEELATRDGRIRAALVQVRELEARRAAVEGEHPPAYEGLSLEGRRAVNLAVLAFAQQLYERFASSGVSQLARQSMLKRVYDCDYGRGEEVRAVMKAAEHAIRDIDELQEDLGDIKARTDRLRRSAVFREPSDVIPVPDSVSVDSGPAGAPYNVLLDECWDVQRVLQR